MSARPSATQTEPVEAESTYLGEIIVSPDGEVISPWWTPVIDEILEALGVAEDDPNRNPWCG